MEVISFGVRLALEKIAGGYPSNVDAVQAYVKALSTMKGVPQEAVEEFEQELVANLPEGELQPPGIVRTGFNMKDGVPLIGSYQVKACLQQAAKVLYDRTSRPSLAQVRKGITFGLEVRPEQIPIQGGTPGAPRTIHQIISHPRFPNIRVPVSRERQIWFGGELTFQVIALPDNPVVPVLEELLETAGMFVGLGTDRGYGYGRFKVVELLEEGKRQVTLTPKEANPRRKGLGHQPQS